MGSRLYSNSNAVRKRITSHTFEDEEGEEYGGSSFGGFGDYFRRKKIKLQNLDVEIRQQSTDKLQIFRGVVAHVNGYTQPSLNDLHKLIVSHGGGFMQYLDGKTTVTHIIASNLTLKKAVEFRRYRIVKPAWVVESIKAGRLLPWDSFRVIDEGPGQQVLGFDGGKVTSQKSMTQNSYRDQTNSSWYTNQLRVETDRPQNPSQSSLAKDQASELEEDAIIDKDIADTGGMEHHTENPQGINCGNQDTSVSNIEPDSKHKKMTAEEHNAILLADPNIRKSTVVNPGFLEQYYRESRLHHLSTWKADLKSQLQSLAAERSSSQNSHLKPPLGSRRYILHVDFDSFFAAVSLKKFPEYKDKPAVVAHGTGSGSEIASCNYPARAYGISNGMWMKRAQDLYPNLKVLPYDFPAYEEASRAFYDVILDCGGLVQSVSIDEALVDVSTLCVLAGGSDGKKVDEGSIFREQFKADEIAQKLREEVKRKTNCNVSIGIGGNILLAKIALRKAKPAGQYQIKPEESVDFIGKLQVTNLPGVANSIGGRLEELGIKYVSDIRDISKDKLISALGPKTGEKIWEYSRGIDRTEVGEQVVRKSVSAEVNWGVRFVNQDQVVEFLASLCGELSNRLIKEKVKGRQFTMKIMKRSADAPLDPPKHLGHGKCDTFNKSTTLGVATNSTETLTKEAVSILKSFNFSPGELRGLGVQMTKLESLNIGLAGQSDSGQKRLQFKPADKSKLVNNPIEDPILDDIISPRKERVQSSVVTFGADELNRASPRKKPLNTLGTQFFMPTQVDPKVLAELPEDIRVKLMSHLPGRLKNVNNHISQPKNKSCNPFISLPSESQLDPEALNALPEDVRAEVLAQYDKSSKTHQEQSPFSSSPRKARNSIVHKKPVNVPRKRGRPPKHSLTSTGSNSTLTQSNFITKHIIRQQPINDQLKSEDISPSPDNTDQSEDEINIEFLAALPEDIRQELLAEHRREALARHSDIEMKATNKRAFSPDLAQPELIQTKLRLLPLPPRPTFTVNRLSRKEDIRKAMSDWVDEFKEDGPYREDLDALITYLKRVIADERDIDKAASVVKWLQWVVEETHEGKDIADNKWLGALEKVKHGVQDAVTTRGLAPIEL